METVLNNMLGKDWADPKVIVFRNASSFWNHLAKLNTVDFWQSPHSMASLFL